MKGHRVVVGSLNPLGPLASQMTAADLHPQEFAASYLETLV